MPGKKDKNMRLQINAVIFDWSGTTVDYGCMAPALAFERIFKDYEIDISMKEIRSFMGLSKKDHIKKILEMDKVSKQWENKYKRKPDVSDLESLYRAFEHNLFSILAKYSKPIEGVAELVKNLKDKGLKIGSTTGYTKEMMQVVSEESGKYGYMPDCIVTHEEVNGGRPYPWMCYMNLIKLKVFPTKTVIKVGDTVSDIVEGVNAGMWSVGIVKGSNELGLSEDEIKNYDKKDLVLLIEEVKRKFVNSGAH
ncbi:phosphonoacetaldehyde hydrolase, partial [bacterium]|nr:phosphonoacetaldehyde hydrolase [bacterium]